MCRPVHRVALAATWAVRQGGSLQYKIRSQTRTAVLSGCLVGTLVQSKESSCDRLGRNLAPMSRPIYRWAALIQIGLTLLTGCHPTQPFFVRRDESMAQYLAQSMDIEYADVQVESLPEATQAHVPLGPTNIPTEFVDLSLEDCIAIALQNTKILRVVNGANSQSGSTTAALLSAAPGQMPSIYDSALVATTSNTQPLTIDSQGNRIAPRGSARAHGRPHCRRAHG